MATLTLLKIPLKDAEARIAAQLEEAKKILPTHITSNTALIPFEEALKRWQRYCGELLGRIFTTSEYRDEFEANAQPIHRVMDRYEEPSNSAILERMWLSLRKQVGVLESLKDRLPIIAEGLDDSGVSAVSTPKDYSKVFVIHGHDKRALAELTGFLLSVSLKPIVLQDLPGGLKTVIEKLEEYSDVQFAVALLTPDDIGKVADPAVTNSQHRARQNVIGELFYFAGKLGRKKIAAFRKGDIEFPSDILGIVVPEMDDHGGWQMKLLKELQRAGYTVTIPS